jgi:hypothetical protein
MSLLGDRRFRCFVDLIRGRGCDMLSIDRDRLMACDSQEVDKVYNIFKEFRELRKSGYDVVCKLVEVAKKLMSENVSDLAVALGIMFNVMFGRQLSEEEAKIVGEVIKSFKCVQLSEDGVYIDNECLDSVNVPENFKDQLRTLTVANLIWSVYVK